MSASNFYHYDDFPNLYCMSEEEIIEQAYHEGIAYDHEDPDAYWDKIEAYVRENFKDYRILTDDEIHELRHFIEECNEEIEIKGNRLYYDGRRECDECEGDYLRTVKLGIEPGYYMGFQIAISGDYRYINKTNKRLVARLMEKIARRFYLYGYGLAYRFSNGETGFNLVKKYKPTRRELAAM